MLSKYLRYLNEQRSFGSGRKFNAAGPIGLVLNDRQIKYQECLQKCLKKGFHVSNISGGTKKCKQFCKSKYGKK